MKSKPRVGETAELEFTVEDAHGIDFSDAVMPKVLSTPWLIWFLEHTARKAVLPHLEDSESTVGVVVNVEHKAPTPIGSKVRCQAKVIYLDGRTISFELKAHDDHDLICQGTHKLRVILKSRLAAAVQKKGSR